MRYMDYYLYDDKYYGNAVINLKSSFFDVVKREEFILNEVENRISLENDEERKTALLDLWTKQRGALKEGMLQFGQLEEIVKVMDSFIEELNNIEKADAEDIINNANNVIDNDPVMQHDVSNEYVREEDSRENFENTIVEEDTTENSIESNYGTIEAPVRQELKQEKMIESNVEEPNVVEETNAQESVQEEIVEPNVEDSIQEEMVESNVEELNVVEETNAQESVQEEIVEPNVEDSIQEDNQPLIPLEEDIIVSDNSIDNNSSESFEEPLISIEDSNLDNIIINTDSSEQLKDENNILENPEEEMHFDESFNSESVSELDVVNEENDGMNLPYEVEVDNIDFSLLDDDKSDDEITNNEVVEIPHNEVEKENNVAKSDYDEENNDSSVKMDNAADLSFIGKEEQESPKAIIVNENQYKKLTNSLEIQKDKLFSRGYLSNEIINNTNYVLEKSMQFDNEHNKDLETMIADNYADSPKLDEEISIKINQNKPDKGIELVKVA